MTFLQPVFLWAVVAAGFPVLLHFLARRKARVYPFSTLRFLKISQQITGRIRKLQELLILLLRVLILIFLVLILAGPVSRKAFLFLSEQSVVFLLDDSLSLSAGEESPWRQLQESSLQVLANLKKTARVALVFLSGKSVSFTSNLEECGKIIKESQPSYFSGSLQSGLNQAQKLLQNRPGSRTIIILSDLQKYAWKDVSLPGAGQHHIRIVVIDVGKDCQDNLGVRNLALVPARNSCQAEVINWNNQTVTTEVELHSGSLEKKLLTIPGRSSQFIQFRIDPTARLLKVKLLRSDFLAADNIFFLHINPATGSRFLLITGNPESAWSLESAIKAFSGQSRLETSFPETLTQVNLADYQTIILYNTGRLPGQTVRFLYQYVRQGGHLLVFTGEKDLPENFNSDWEIKEEKTFFMPAKLEELVSFKNPASIIWGDNKHPFFAPFADRLLEYLRNISFYQVFRCSTTEGNVLLKLDRGFPLLLEGQRAAGSIILCPFLPDLSWTNLPKRPFFPVLIEIIMRHLASGASPSCLVGQAIWAPPETETMEVVSPEGWRKKVPASDVPPLKFVPDKPGLWEFTFSPRGIKRFVSVNVDWQEGDLARQNPASIYSCFPSARVSLITPGKLQQFLLKEATSTDFSGILLLLTLLLFLTEVATSNFFHWKKISKKTSFSPGDKK